MQGGNGFDRDRLRSDLKQKMTTTSPRYLSVRFGLEIPEFCYNSGNLAVVFLHFQKIGKKGLHVQSHLLLGANICSSLSKFLL